MVQNNGALENLLRLRIMASLSRLEEIRWEALQDLLAVRPYELSRALQTLSTLEYLEIRRSDEDRRRKIVVPTAAGIAAYRAYAQELQAILGDDQRR